MATSSPTSSIFTHSATGHPHSNLANINAAFVHDAQLRQSLWYDEFLDRILTGAPAREWQDADDTRVAVYLQREHGLTGVSSRQVSEIVNRYAREQPRHCVRDWLKSLTWDGIARIEESFCDHWGAVPSEKQPHEYLRAISRNFFVGLVARVFQPGCQLDEMVVFESPHQGLFKTSALRALAGPWYAAAHERISDKDFFQDLQGKWIVEISELAAFSRAQVERIKHTITTCVDHFRASYDRRSTDHPRQCVFAGTTNTTDWGTDETGLRRFWPLTVGVVDIPALTAARPQLFAEAIYEFHHGSGWWTVPQSALAVQAERQQYDEWAELILPWASRALVQGAAYLKIYDILTDALKFPPNQIDKSAQMRVARILVLAHWTRDTIRIGDTIAKVWWPPQSGNGSNVF